MEGESHGRYYSSHEPLSISINNEIVYSTSTAWFTDVKVDKEHNYAFLGVDFNGEKYQETIYINGKVRHQYDFIDGFVLLDHGFAYVGCNGPHVNYNNELHKRKCELVVRNNVESLQYNHIKNLQYDAVNNQLIFDAIIGCTIPDPESQCHLYDSQKSCNDAKWARLEACDKIEEPKNVNYPL